MVGVENIMSTLAIQERLRYEASSVSAEIDDGSSGTSKNLDLSVGSAHKLLMTGACTVTFTAPLKPGFVFLKFTQDGTGTRVLTLPTIKKIGGAAIVLTVTAGAIDRIILWYDGSAYWEVMRGLAYA